MEWKQFYIKKSNGKKRLITSPNERLKKKQRKILKELYEIYPTSKFRCAFGGLPFKNIKKLAECHIGKSILIRLDVKDFFPSINKDILMKKLKTNFKEMKIKNRGGFLKSIEKFCFYEDKIPQGAVTSPLLSNIYLTEFDKIISSIMKDGYFNYSRYFDDLTFSLDTRRIIIDGLDNENKIEPLSIGQIIQIVKHYLDKYELKLNYKKTKIMKIGKRQSVCNLTTNEKINIDRKYYKLLRAIKHHFETKKETTITKEQYLGHLAFVQSINQEKYEKLIIEL